MPDYSEYYDSMAESLAQQTELAMRQLEIAERQASYSEAQFDFYKTNFLPALKELLTSAEQGIDTDYASVLAGQMTTAAFKGAKVSRENELSRLGVNRSSDVLQGIESQADEAEKTAVTTSKNVARTEAVDANQRMRLEIAGMASGTQVQAMSALDQSSATLAQSSASGARGAAGMESTYRAQAEAQTAAAMTQQQAQFNAAQFSADASFANQIGQAQAQATLYGGIATLATAGIMTGMASTGPKMGPPPTGSMGSTGPAMGAPGTSGTAGFSTGWHPSGRTI